MKEYDERYLPSLKSNYVDKSDAFSVLDLIKIKRKTFFAFSKNRFVTPFEFYRGS